MGGEGSGRLDAGSADPTNQPGHAKKKYKGKRKIPGKGGVHKTEG